MTAFTTRTPWAAAGRAILDGRPKHAVRLWWRMRHHNDDHFPGCPVGYGKPGECLFPDDLCKQAREDNRRTH